MNAEIAVPEPEWDFWMDDAKMSKAEGAVKRYFLNARRIFKDIGGEVRRFKPGSEVAPGVEEAVEHAMRLRGGRLGAEEHAAEADVADPERAERDRLHGSLGSQA